VKQFITICLLAITLIGSPTFLSYGQIKLAQTGFNFVGVSSDARAGAMGDAMTSLIGYRDALFHNPATMAEMHSLVNASFSVNSWIADIKYLSFGVVISPHSGDYGVIGISVQTVDYGDVQGTMVYNNKDGYIDIGNMNPEALAIGIGYAKMISDRFGVGGQVRFAYQSLGKSVVPDIYTGQLKSKQNVANVIAFDFGTIYRTGIKSLVFGMSVRNFSKEVKFEEEGFQLPLLFSIGISANVLDFTKWAGSNHSLLLSVDATHPRAHPEQLKFGLEYEFKKTIALRAGYITNNSEDGITYGVGFSSSGLNISSGAFQVDYSYTPFGVFDNVQRFTVSLSI
jgi:hypothetical protein